MDFIEVYENAVPERLCKSIIETFENCVKSGYVCWPGESASGKMSREDLAIPLDLIRLDEARDLNSYLDSALQKYFSEYAGINMVLSSIRIKVQKTKVGGGYHDWHHEKSDAHTAGRVLVWSVYLNDVAEGGETEFLYQHKRFKPTLGTLMIWPAQFTHTHRGNPPLSGEKYIVTGWYNLTES